MTKEELNKLKSKQPFGYRTEIAEEIGCSPEYVDMVLRGDRNNQNIIDMAITKAIAYKKHLNQQQKKVQAL